MDKTVKVFLKPFEDIKEIPPLPAIIVKINQMMDNQDTDIDSLCRVIEKDQAVVFKMLLLVNSVFFGFREKISSVNEAAIILGLDAIRNITISLSAFNTLDKLAKQKSNTAFSLEDFWNHSLGVAVLSRYLSEKTRMGNPEKCFVSGLLHDMGKLILACYFPDKFTKIIRLSEKGQILYRHAEEKIIPAGHHEIGYTISKRWHLPDHISDTLHCHHRIPPGSKALEQCIVINTADGIINSFTCDSINNNVQPGQIDYRYFEPCSINKMQSWIDSSMDWFSEVNRMIREAKILLLEI